MARGNRREAMFLVDYGGESELDWRKFGMKSSANVSI